MYQKLLATLPAIFATTAFAQPIYFTANDIRTNPPATVGVKTNAPDYPDYLNQPIYFIANKLRAASTTAAAGTRSAEADYPDYLDQPIYFTANKLRTGAGQVSQESRADTQAAAALGSTKHVPAN